MYCYIFDTGIIIALSSVICDAYCARKTPARERRRNCS